MAEASEAEGPNGPHMPEASEPKTPAEAGQVTVADSHVDPVAGQQPSNGSEGASAPAAAADAPSPPGATLEADGSETEEAGADDAAAGVEGAGAGDEAGGEPGTGKRKRRRRRKRKGDSEAGDRDAPAAAAPGEAREGRGGKRREVSNAPFLRFFSAGQGARKHGFAVAEVVAGRVKSVEHGSIAVDLFGKAMAYADEFEPREVPPAQEPKHDALEASAPDAVMAGAEPMGAGSGALDPSPAPEAPVTESSAGAIAAADAAAPPGMASGSEGAPDASPVAVEPVDVEPGTLEPGMLEPPSDPLAASEAHQGDHGDAVLELDDDHDHAETTLAGEPAPGGHGPLPPAPVVPEEYPRVEPPSLGQVFRGRVGWISESGHIALVNRDIERKTVLAHLERYRSDRRRVQGLIFGFNRGGFDVLVEGVRAFCPASAMTLDELDDPSSLLGHKLEFLLPASQTVTKDIIVSRRSILERQLRKRAKELVRSLEAGQRIKGRVTQVREFGVFVDIGGVDGLVHQSELSYAHGVKPSDVAAVGDEVEVQVLRVGAEPMRAEGGARKDRDRPPRVSLSIKALLPDPWDAHADALAEGAVRRGKVTRTTDFGAFVELVPQIEGLLHITELGRDLKHANQAVAEGDEVFVVVERVDKRARRITLSRLSAQEMADYESGQAASADAPKNLRVGSRIKVVVARVESRGLVVRVAGVVGKRARGYVPSIELGERAGDLRKAFPIGAEIEVKVVGIDRDGGLRCSPKALAVDEERRAVKDYRREAAKQGFGTFGDLLRAKLGQADPK
jgi:small subunit ribosomal protein S1